MKRIAILLLAIIILLCGCGEVENDDKNLATEDLMEYDFSSGIWLSYSEINSMLKSEKGFKKEFKDVIANCKTLKITDIYVHVRAFCDSLYPSKLYPMVEGAKGYDYDILDYIILECRKSNIRVHAWINPYRVSTSTEDINILPSESPAYKWLTDANADNDINVVKSNGIYLNPAEEEVRKLVTEGIKEILDNYDVQGIHFDDYFYPTQTEEFDKASYEEYLSSTDTPESLASWRRANVNSLISSCYTTVKFYNKDLLFTVSPMASIEGNYNNLYADIESWIENGCIDWIIPQIYFGYNYPDDKFAFGNLLKEWTDLADKNKKVKLIVGLSFYKSGTYQTPDNEEWQTGTDIIARQVKDCKENNNVSGFALFSYSYVFSDNEICSSQRDNLQEYINSIT